MGYNLAKLCVLTIKVYAPLPVWVAGGEGRTPVGGWIRCGGR